MPMSPAAEAARRERLSRNDLRPCSHEHLRSFMRLSCLRNPSIPRRIRNRFRRIRVRGAVLLSKAYSPEELRDFIKVILAMMTQDVRDTSEGYSNLNNGDYPLNMETTEDAYDVERLEMVYNYLNKILFNNTLPPFEEVFEILPLTSPEYLSGQPRWGELFRQTLHESQHAIDIGYTIRLYCHEVPDEDPLSAAMLTYGHLLDELMRQMINLNARTQLYRAIGRTIENEPDNQLFETYLPSILGRPPVP
ncbi:hypothetical protein M7I_8094 [Glarea lozoyensis 74030]|uniref:Uncharacterized protein n=1 Tax=Glarea lozoyensis (strain ATCC 74030 / MF5533) TaxID=1104152 RepID=H0EZ32_GLAL7|nr:hypothetical protein M7I_8094 [Glarea lozoyensis 74030]